MTKDEAIAAHKAWKVRFRVAMAKREALDVEQIAANDRCQFGQWLYSAGKQEFGHLAEYERCVEAHSDFHRECGKVADALNTQGIMAAERMLGFDTEYAKTSERLGMAIAAMYNAKAAT